MLGEPLIAALPVTEALSLLLTLAVGVREFDVDGEAVAEGETEDDVVADGEIETEATCSDREDKGEGGVADIVRESDGGLSHRV